MSRKYSLGCISVGIVSGASLLFLSACAEPQGRLVLAEKRLESYDGPNASRVGSSEPGPPHPGPQANIAEAQKTMDENPGMDWNTAANLTIERKLGWDKLPSGALTTNLPADLDGVSLLGDDGSEVKLYASGKATLQTPQDSAPVDATYVIDNSGLTLIYTDSGKECKVAFAAQRIGRKVQLNVQSSTLPKLPSVLKGTLKE